MKHQLSIGSILSPTFETKEELYEWIEKDIDRCWTRPGFKEKKKLYYYGIYESNGIEIRMTKEAAEAIYESWDYTAYMQSEETTGFRFALKWWIKYGPSGEDVISELDPQVKKQKELERFYSKNFTLKFRWNDEEFNSERASD